jgi:hypothetical protein
MTADQEAGVLTWRLQAGAINCRKQGICDIHGFTIHEKLKAIRGSGPDPPIKIVTLSLSLRLLSVIPVNGRMKYLPLSIPINHTNITE